MKTSRGYKSINATHVLRLDPCAYCGRFGTKSVPSTIDHIVPRAAGGQNAWFNYTAACAKCNNDKGDLSLLEYLLDGNGKRPKDQRLHRGRGRTQRKAFKYMNALVPERWFDPFGLYKRSNHELAPTSFW